MSFKVTLWNAETPNLCSVGWWRNFYHENSQRRGETMSMSELNRILKEYRAKYVSTDREIYIEFGDERYYSMFVLRYS